MSNIVITRYFQLLIFFCLVLFFILFFCQSFLFQTLTTYNTTGSEGNHILFLSTISICSWKFRHLFATLRLIWLPHIFNRPLVTTRLLLDGFYHLIELPFDWLMMWCLISHVSQLIYRQSNPAAPYETIF